MSEVVRWSWPCTRHARGSLLAAAVLLCLGTACLGSSSGHSANTKVMKVETPPSTTQDAGPSMAVRELALARVTTFMSRGISSGTVWAEPSLLKSSTWGAAAAPASGSRQEGVAAASDSDSAASMTRLVSCINSKYEPKNMTWDAAMADELASVKVIGAWWTSKLRRVPLTVVTQSTVDRIPQLYQQCKSWRGPLSVVLYQALVQDSTDTLTPSNQRLLQQAILNVAAFFEEVERDGDACMPDILLVYEIYTEQQATLLYPINLLRNLARLQARTPMLALLDVDMLMSRNFYNDLLIPTVQKQMVQNVQNKAVYVLPAFETYGSTQEAAGLADVLVTQDKEFLVWAVNKGTAGPFDSRRFIPGHNSTNFAKWYTSNKDYDIVYGERYEPWLVVDRHNVPWHDVRFRGYGNNKIQLIAHINSSNFQFVVHHSAFIIHRAHKETAIRGSLLASKSAFDKATKENRPVDTTSVYGHTRTLFDQAKALMDQGRFQAVVDPATRECFTSLPWWRTVRRRREYAFSRALQHGNHIADQPIFLHRNHAQMALTPQHRRGDRRSLQR